MPQLEDAIIKLEKEVANYRRTAGKKADYNAAKAPKYRKASKIKTDHGATKKNSNDKAAYTIPVKVDTGKDFTADYSEPLSKKELWTLLAKTGAGMILISGLMIGMISYLRYTDKNITSTSPSAYSNPTMPFSLGKSASYYNTQLSEVKSRLNEPGKLSAEEERKFNELYGIFPGNEINSHDIKEILNATVCNLVLEELIPFGKKHKLDTTEAEELDKQVDEKIIYKFEDFFMFAAKSVEKFEKDRLAEAMSKAGPGERYYIEDKWDPLYVPFLDLLYKWTSHSKLFSKVHDKELFSALAKKLSEKAERGEYRMTNIEMKEEFYERLEELTKK